VQKSGEARMLKLAAQPQKVQRKGIYLLLITTNTANLQFAENRLNPRYAEQSALWEK
jgi:hypothetical protein